MHKIGGAWGESVSSHPFVSPTIICRKGGFLSHTLKYGQKSDIERVEIHSKAS